MKDNFGDLLKDRLTRAFEMAADRCGEQIESFNPTIDNGGIHEMNQVLLFLNALCIIDPSDTFVWVELPFYLGKNKGRIDGVAFVKSENQLVLIEAKRIKQRKGRGDYHDFDSIIDDMNRMDELERLKNLVHDREGIKIVKVVLASIWVNGETEKYLQDFISRKKFPPNWQNATILKEQCECNKYKDPYYYLMAITKNITYSELAEKCA